MASSNTMESSESGGVRLEANREADSFFALPPVTADPEYKDQGNTKMVWTGGYVQYVTFEPWDDFDEKVWGKAMTFFRSMTVDMVKRAGSSLDTARGYVEDGNEEYQRVVQERASSEAEEDEYTKVEGTEDGAGYWTNSATITKVTSNVFGALERLFLRSLGNLYCKYSVKCQPEMKISTLKLSDEHGKEIILEMPQGVVSDCGVVLQLVQSKTSKKRKTPDSSSIRVLPLCNFEVKGPTLDMTGIAAAKKVHTELQKQRNAERNKVGGTSGLETSSEGGAQIRLGGQDQNQVPNVTDSQHGNDLSENPGDTSDPHRAYTAAEVADNFNFIFSSSAFLDIRKSLGAPIRDSIYRVSQAITNAILSLGGCSVLYNMNTAIAFEVKGIVNRKLVIGVTGVMRSDTSPSCVSALYAVGKYCLDQYFDKGVADLMGRVRKVATGVSRKAAGREDESPESSHEEYFPGSEEGTDESEAPGSDGLGAEATLLLQMELGLDFNSLVVPYVPAHTSYDSKQRILGVMSPTTVLADARKLSERKSGKRIDKAIMNMFMRHKGVVGSGSSGTVVRSCFIGKDVAVKIAFDNCKSGTAALRKEITAYLELHRERSPLLGSVLPKLVLAWNSPSLNSVYAHMVFLVTEFVGRGLVRDKKGVLWIGDSVSGYRVVDEQEEQKICASALSGLRRLRDFGRLHGDIALRNLRAERMENASGVVWKTWWVDLGLSSTIQSRWDDRLFAVDCMDTRSLFKD